MKRTIILALVAALIVAAPVSAAGLDISGAIETKIEVNKKGEDVTVVPGSELSLNLGLSAAEDKVRAGLEFGLAKEEDDDLVPTDITLGDIALKQAFIEADGAFWHGGPEATTRFGTLDIAYSPYASLTKRSGISISGVDVELAELNGFYALAGEHGHVLGMRGDLRVLEEVAIGASVIADAEITRLQLDAAAAPLEGLRVRGSVAADHTEDSGLKMNNLWKVEAGYELAENTAITAGYKHITDGFVPRYVAEASEDGTAEHDWIHLPRAKNSGLFVGFETEQQGVELHADYDQMFAEAKIGAGTEYEGFRFDVETVLDVPAVSSISAKSTTFGVGREFEVMEGLAIDASYEGKWLGGTERKLVHTIGASTTLGFIPAIDGLELSAEVSASELALESVDYKVGAKFAAPNGVNLGIEHARSTGTTFNAGMKVEF
ncbi:MAG: hypothetical protein WAP45_08375 [Limnochordia bacterium]|jgi:opacity protein-like surface antigen|nr:hypothetical protein [Bacillota bacterium]HOQ74847.1 hypothetical protein [Limnochordia bacterium]